MYTYTTPTITCTLTGVDFASVDYVRIAIKGMDASVIRTVGIADIDTEEGTAVVELTQEETASLGAGQVAIQARIHYLDESVQATNKVLKTMSEVLDKVVI